MSDIKETVQNLIDDGRVIQDDNKLRVKNKLNEWKSQASGYGDEYLAKLKTAMLKVFCEESPEFDIEKEQRLFADPASKKTHYSGDLREGLAIELALIGNYSDLLVNCSPALRSNFAADIVHEVFVGATWKRIATLDPVLPFLAEASPYAFLNEMMTLANKKNIFRQLVDDEGDNIFSSGSHLTGISLALETLAWEPEYLIPVISVAANLFLLDRESNIHPRPQDILSGILLPWFPQTLASETTLITAANFLLLQNKELGWDTVLASIGSRTGSPHRLPRVRQSIPDGFTNEPSTDGKLQCRLTCAYKNLLLNLAESDTSFVLKIARHIKYFSDKEIWKRTLAILASPVVLQQDDEFKEPIWTQLKKVCIKHRKHETTAWAMSKDKLKEIDRVIELLKPQSLLFQSKHLFDGTSWDWFESGDYDTERDKFQKAGVQAVKLIFDRYGREGIFNMLKLAKSPFELGVAVSLADIHLAKTKVASLLDDSSDMARGFIGGYLWQSYSCGGGKWLSSFKNAKFRNAQKTAFLCCLPFRSSIWYFCEAWLGRNEKLYWQTFSSQPTPGEPDRLFAIRKAQKYKRPDIATASLFWELQEKKQVDFDICAQTLLALSESECIKNADTWQITQLIAALQKQTRTKAQTDSLIQIEFLYLPLLDSSAHDDVSPVTLDSALAEDPKFFHQILTFACKSKKSKKNTPDNDGRARNALNLLLQWKKMPGFVNSVLDYNAFIKWYDTVIKLCKDSGHLRVGQTLVGHILFYAPADPYGFWIDKRIAALLDQPKNDNLRHAYYVAAYNARGARFVDMSGEEDLKLAQKYESQAKDLEKEKFSRFAEVFRALAKDSENEAEQHKKEGERLKHQDEL